MRWLMLAAWDFFAALGFFVFFGVLFVMWFMDGSAEEVNVMWILGPTLLFSWLRGEFYHWPKETRHDQD